MSQLRHLSELFGMDRSGLHLRDRFDPDAAAALLGSSGVSNRVRQVPERCSEGKGVAKGATLKLLLLPLLAAVVIWQNLGTAWGQLGNFTLKS